MEDQETLAVFDPIRAAVLLTKNCSLIDAPESRKDPNKLVFIFADPNGSARIAAGAIAANELLPIGSFLQHLRHCHELIGLFKISKGGRR